MYALLNEHKKRMA